MITFDPITIEIAQNSLQAAADEMFAAMRRTAMSAIIYEVLDMGTGITNADGDLVGSGAGIPTFIGMLDKAVKQVLERFKDGDDIEPEDIFIVNDPYLGGVTHLNDIILCLPVFTDDQIIAWTANTAHWNDVGGMAPGSMSTEATEIFQEGIQLPIIKLFSQGQLIRSVVDILYANSRMPDYLKGDLWAGIAALRLGKKRILELMTKYGVPTFLHAMDDYLDYGEKVTLKALQKMPKGQFFVKEEQDNGQVYSVETEIKDDQFIVDLRNNPDQGRGPYNLSRDGAEIAAQMVLKAITSPQTVCNGGTFRPLKVLTRKGSVFDPIRPAAMGFYYEVRIRLYDLIWRSLAEHFPDRIPSGHFASICGTIIGGIHPDTGRHYSVIEPELGGWGGSAQGDGNSAMFSACHGETYNCPAEISEMRNGIFVERYAFHGEDGGEGMHRGGRGICIDYRLCSHQAWLTAAYTRSKIPPWGLMDGRPGSTNYVLIIHQDGTTERYSAVTGLKLQKGDVIRIVTANGAGWGDPKKRDIKKIIDDLKNGFITMEQAERYYGYVGDVP